MNTLFNIVFFCLITSNLYAEEHNITLYPVYDPLMDNIAGYPMNLLKIHKYYTWGEMRHGKVITVQKSGFILNINNLLVPVIEEPFSNGHVLLGKVMISQSGDISYEFFDSENWKVNRKIFELKKNIAYLNDGEFNLEQIKKILNADLINDNLGEKLYINKVQQLPTRQSSYSLINCRFCDQLIEIIKYYGQTKLDQGLLFNDIEVTNPSEITRLLTKIKKKGNLYRQLDRKYIAKTYEEWKEIVPSSK